MPARRRGQRDQQTPRCKARARYGHITTVSNDGRNTYLMSEVLAHASKAAG